MASDPPAFPDCTPDTVNGFRHLHQAYTATDPRYTGKVTVRARTVPLLPKRHKPKNCRRE